MTILLVIVLLLVVVWMLRGALNSGRLENAAWLRAAKDSEMLVNGAAQALHSSARLVLSLIAATLYTLAAGLTALRKWLLRSPVADAGGVPVDSKMAEKLP